MRELLGLDFDDDKTKIDRINLLLLIKNIYKAVTQLRKQMVKIMQLNQKESKAVELVIIKKTIKNL